MDESAATVVIGKHQAIKVETDDKITIGTDTPQTIIDIGVLEGAVNIGNQYGTTSIGSSQDVDWTIATKGLVAIGTKKSTPSITIGRSDALKVTNNQAEAEPTVAINGTLMINGTQYTTDWGGYIGTPDSTLYVGTTASSNDVVLGKESAIVVKADGAISIGTEARVASVKLGATTTTVENPAELTKPAVIIGHGEAIKVTPDVGGGSVISIGRSSDTVDDNKTALITIGGQAATLGVSIGQNAAITTGTSGIVSIGTDSDVPSVSIGRDSAVKVVNATQAEIYIGSTTGAVDSSKIYVGTHESAQSVTIGQNSAITTGVDGIVEIGTATAIPSVKLGMDNAIRVIKNTGKVEVHIGSESEVADAAGAIEIGTKASVPSVTIGQNGAIKTHNGGSIEIGTAAPAITIGENELFTLTKNEFNNYPIIKLGSPITGDIVDKVLIGQSATTSAFGSNSAIYINNNLINIGGVSSSNVTIGTVYGQIELVKNIVTNKHDIYVGSRNNVADLCGTVNIGTTIAVPSVTIGQNSAIVTAENGIISIGTSNAVPSITIGHGTNGIRVENTAIDGTQVYIRGNLYRPSDSYTENNTLYLGTSNDLDALTSAITVGADTLILVNKDLNKVNICSSQEITNNPALYLGAFDAIIVSTDGNTTINTANGSASIGKGGMITTDASQNTRICPNNGDTLYIGQNNAIKVVNAESGGSQVYINDILYTTPGSYEREYFMLNLYGRLNNDTYDNTTQFRKFLIMSGYWWEPANINPNNNIGGSVVRSSELSYDITTGKIQGLNTSKRYAFSAQLNLNAIDINTQSRYMLALVNTDISYDASANANFGVHFSPICDCQTSQRIDYAGTGLTLSYVITGCTSFTLLLRNLVSLDLQSVQYFNDTTLSVSLTEL
jgi:hypothetical protein